MNASISTTPAALGGVERLLDLCRDARCSGFSQSTCFPAAMARIVHSWCIPFGSGM